MAPRSRGSRCTWAAPWPAATAPAPGSAASCAASRRPPRTCPAMWSGCSAGSRRPASRARASPPGPPGLARRTSHEHPGHPVLLPVLRRGGPRTAGRDRRAMALPQLRRDVPAKHESPMSPATTHGPEGVLVAVAHGSAVPQAAGTIADLMTVVAERAARRGVHLPDLRIAYLGHTLPSLPQVLSTIEPGTRVAVLPLLLTAAYHGKTEIPRVLGDFPRLRVSYGAPLGPHPLTRRRGKSPST